jgi:hypothetical protein
MWDWYCGEQRRITGLRDPFEAFVGFPAAILVSHGRAS